MKDACSGYHKTQITFMPAVMEQQRAEGWREELQRLGRQRASQDKEDTGAVDSLLEKNVSIII